MTLKPIDYLSFKDLRRRKVGTVIVKSSVSKMTVQDRPVGYKGEREKVIYVYMGIYFPSIEVFPMTEEGYEAAKKCFEEYTLNWIKEFVETWTD